MVDRNLMQLVPRFVQLPVQSLVLRHQLLDLFFSLAHLGTVYVQFLSQLSFPFLLFVDYQLVFPQFSFLQGHCFLKTQGMLVRFDQPFFHQSNVGFKVSEVLSQMVDFFLEWPFTGLCIAQLDFQSIDGPGFLGFNVKKHMDFHFHFVLLPFHILQQGFQLLGVELLLG